MSFDGQKLHFSMSFDSQKLHFSIIFRAAKNEVSRFVMNTFLHKLS